MKCVFTVRNEVAKVMFLQASVCPQGGKVPDQVHPPQGADNPRARYTPWTRYTPQTRYTPRTRYTPQTRYTPPGPITSPQTRFRRDQVHPLGPGIPPGTGTPPQSRHPPGTRYTPPGPGTPPPRYGHYCGRYASYWNAFLFAFILNAEQ